MRRNLHLQYLRLKRSFWKRAHRLRHGDEFFICRYANAQFIVRLVNFMDREIGSGTYDWDRLEVLLGACRRLRPELFIDIGANSGLYSCIIVKNDLAPRAIAFEPDRRNAVMLKANVLINGLDDRIDVREVGVGARPGRMKLVPGPQQDTGLSRMAGAADGHAAAGYMVDIVPLDDVVDLSGRTIAIKIDVERYELQALAGMTRTLRHNRGVVQIESWETRKDVVGIMADCGYRVIADLRPDVIFEKA